MKGWVMTFLSESADIVTVSHQHYDHNYIEAVEGLTPGYQMKAGDFSM
jgi:L-ascorbate metabolism protein UlaG (beta-lactamase superfamily)